MSDESFRGFDILHEAFRNEDFRRRFTEVDELESQYEQQSFNVVNRSQHIQTDGEEMTIPDQQRQTVRDAIKKSVFHDQEMQDFAVAESFELGDVLRRAKTLAGDPGHPDTSIAQDIIVLIRGFTLR